MSAVARSGCDDGCVQGFGCSTTRAGGFKVKRHETTGVGLGEDWGYLEWQNGAQPLRGSA